MALLLAFSSIPLHLFYNASIFQIATFNEYGIAVIQNGTDKWQDMDKDAAFRNASSKYEKFIGSAWQSVYNVKYVAENEDLYLVVDRFAFNVTQDWVNIDVTKYFNRHRAASNQGLLREILYESSDWIRYEAFYDNQTAKDWPVSAHVDHAFSRKKVGNSRLQLSLVYILVVIACNALKLSIMIWTLIIDRSAYIVTLGDGVASFLQHPDPVTRSHCMLGKEEMLYKLGYMPYHELEGEELDTFNLRVDGVWLPQRRRFFALMGQDRQIFFAVLFCCVLSACIILPFTGRASSGYSMMRAWGTDSEDVLPFGSGLLLNAWLVNLPQIILSFCYLALNAICTSMASAQEWNNVAHTRKGLRVTRPFAEQRSTYFLQLPYRWAVPLIVTSGILHWLLSQSFFLVRLNVVNASNVVVESQTTSGYARLSLLVFFAVALILILVISAACHPSNNQARDLHLKKVKWGVVDETVDNGYAHCSITAGSLKKVKVGQKYR
ncbi:hypothetical protein E8E12_004407 [Didymella heteroderae]|uniref:DUF6536 domain-containing protein n=1 Tax=Didymella heteroderae TaxID=1769908 RepID=A0A9P4WIZ3_9PLEO|nr:hypothetical protein E8E12_004407 [Didymella heteroderae]